jgi:hypothetical protein
VHFERADYAAAIADCDAAVEKGRELRADYALIARALARKGNALVKLERLEEAIAGARGHAHARAAAARVVCMAKTCTHARTQMGQGAVPGGAAADAHVMGHTTHPAQRTTSR